MEKDIVLGDDDFPETYELAIKCSLLKKQMELLDQKQRERESLKELSQNLSKITGCSINLETTADLNNYIIPDEEFYQAMDETFNNPGDLIKNSHDVLPYSLLKQNKDLKNLVPVPTPSLGIALTGIWVRGNEILSEFSSENTERAFKGDLVYWQAWLSAMGYTFKHEPINENHVKAFIIQHLEGLPHEIDQKLVEQGYKQVVGTHKMATVKRRLASLSVHLQINKLPNPCTGIEVKKILEKLSKKNTGHKRKAKAITLDVLIALLDTCGNTLIDKRDKAILLFGWGSGGRRRSEIAEAEMENLEELKNGNYHYRMVKSKTDQTGAGKTFPINGRAANALRDWIETSGIKEGKIFRSVHKGGKHVGEEIGPVDINRMVKRRCEKAGYDPKLFSAHSLRSGFVTEAGKQGKPIGDVMELSGHKSVTTAMGYYQVGNLENNTAANLV
jgi:integrase